MRLKLATIIAFYLLAVSFKVGYTWAQAWVDDKTVNIKDLSPLGKTGLKSKALQLILLPKKYVVKTTTNGNTYLRCFVVNTTDTTATILRADATIAGFTSEIYKNGSWQAFQASVSITCGNSYWKQQLKPGQALAIRYGHNENGPVTIPFRIRFAHNGGILFSNVIMVQVDQKKLRTSGQNKA